MRKVLVLLILFPLILIVTNASEEECSFELKDKVTQYTLEYLYSTEYYNGGHNEETFSCRTRKENQDYLDSFKINNSPEGISKVIKLYNGLRKLDSSSYDDTKLEILKVLTGIIEELHQYLYIHNGFVYTFENKREQIEGELWTPEKGEQFSQSFKVDINTGEKLDIDLGIPLTYMSEWKEFNSNHSPKYQIINYDSSSKELLIGLYQSFRIYGSSVIIYYKIDLEQEGIKAISTDGVFEGTESALCTRPVGWMPFQEDELLISVGYGHMIGDLITKFNTKKLTCERYNFKIKGTEESKYEFTRTEIIEYYKAGRLELLEFE